MLLARHALTRGLVAFIGAALVAACDNTTEPTSPSQVTAVGSPAVSGRVGDAVPVSVKVANANGKVLQGQVVTFTVGSGGGRVANATVTTGADGVAQNTWTLGSTLGAQTLTAATSSGVSLVFIATVTPGAPASIAATAGNTQTATVGTLLPARPTVQVKDAAGNPVPGIQVNFTATAGGVVSGSPATTDANGNASVAWQLGPTAGAQSLVATIAGTATGNPVTFTATATPGQAAAVVGNAPLTGTGTAGTALGTAALPSIIVRDAQGNPVQGANVTFAVTAGGGTLTGATQTTNAQGVATVGGFTLGNTAGPNTVVATVGNLGSVSFTYTGTAGAAAAAAVQAGNNQSVPAGQPLQVGPSVVVRDRFGNPVAGVTVNFVVTAGGGSVLGGTQTTNAQGVATVGGWTLGAIPGTNTLVARVAGLPDVTFTATGQAGAPATITKVSGDSLTVTTFRAASQPFVVLVRDAAGYPVQGTTVTFAVDTGGGTLNPATATTDALGRASTTWTAGGFVGEATIRATVGSLAPVIFRSFVSGSAAASVRVVQGLNQTATAGGAVGLPPAVQVLDAQGFPVPGVTVLFEVVGQGGVPNVEVVTDQQGIASAGVWTLGATPGRNTLVVTVSAPRVANNPIIFTATGFNLPSGTTITHVTSSTPTTAAAGSTVSAQVLVRDAAGQPVANASVEFQVAAGGGTIPGGAANGTLYRTVTDAAGVATIPQWRLGSTAGLNSLAALLVPGGGSVIINVTGQ